MPPGSPEFSHGPDASRWETLKLVMEEMSTLASFTAPSGDDLARLHELEARLSDLLGASALRCRVLADRLAVLEEHAVNPATASAVTSAGAAALANRLRIAQAEGELKLRRLPKGEI